LVPDNSWDRIAIARAVCSGVEMKKPIFLALLAIAIPVAAQTAQKDMLLKHWKISGDFTIAVASAMPADGYTFRPTPEEMSFGELMAHIAALDRNSCANASGLTPPALPARIAEWAQDTVKMEVDRETGIQFIKDSFEFCYKAITDMPMSRMDSVVGPPKRNLTGFEWLWSYFTHTAHHRGQAEVYLRLKGIKPPEYAF
jgi:uncharacterized damage-inducible protein DinB